MILYETVDSPVGKLFIAAEERGTVAISFAGDRHVADELARLARAGVDVTGARRRGGALRGSRSPDAYAARTSNGRSPGVADGTRSAAGASSGAVRMVGGPRTHGKGRGDDPDDVPRAERHLAAAIVQLGEYFEGARDGFDLDLYLLGTEFQEKVWRALTRIARGRTRTYAEIAKTIGCPRGTRAVGAAVGDNPVAIVVPCHRVIGSNGSLTGFGGGLKRKRWLLDHESGTRALPLVERAGTQWRPRPGGSVRSPAKPRA